MCFIPSRFCRFIFLNACLTCSSRFLFRPLQLLKPPMIKSKNDKNTFAFVQFSSAEEARVSVQLYCCPPPPFLLTHTLTL